MKKWILCCVFLICCAHYVAAQTKSLTDLQGEWESTDRFKGGSVHFIDESRILMVFPNGKILRGIYQINFSNDPISIDIIREDNDTLQGLVEFIDEATIRWKIFPAHNRTNNFSRQRNTSIAVFKRKKYIS